MIKVAHTSLIYFRLSENWIHTQLKHLNDCESVVFTNKIENLDSVDWHPRIFSRQEQIPFGIREADSLVLWMLGYYPSFYYQAKKENIDLIHAHFGPMGYYSVGIARKLKIPLVTTFYGYDASLLPKREPKWRSKFKTLFKYGSLFLVEGPAMKNKLEGLGCPSNKITIHHLGIEQDKYPARETYSLEGPLSILMVGRFVEKKGFIYGLKTFRKFLAQGGKGTLTIVGDSSGNPESERVKEGLLRYVDEHEMNASITFTGMISLEKLQQVYYDHDVFLAPSVEAENGDDEGGAPVTIIEASASGMPVVGSLHCDIPEVVKEDKTGLLADEKDVETLAAHLFRLFDNPELRKELGKAGANHIRENFNAAKQGKVLSRLYKQCIEN